MNDAIDLIEKTKESLQKCNGQKGKSVYEKFKKILSKNVGYDTITKISKILNGENESIQLCSEELSPNDMTFFKYAPISSVDVERTFSRYKNLLTDKRRSMVFENIAKIIVIQCNSHLGK